VPDIPLNLPARDLNNLVGKQVDDILKVDRNALPPGRMDELQHVFDAIASVHGTPGVSTQIPITYVNSGQWYGVFRSQNKIPHSISIDLGNPPARRRSTIAHEIGHYLDLMLPGSHEAFTSEYAAALHLGKPKNLPGKLKKAGIVVEPELVRVFEAMYGTSTITRMQAAKLDSKGYNAGHYQLPGGSQIAVRSGSLAYYLEPKEMWARAYAQYIGVRGGSADIMAEIDLRRKPTEFMTQWEDHEFEAIALAMDSYFEAIGWRVKK
jgi:hypothetical protein